MLRLDGMGRGPRVPGNLCVRDSAFGRLLAPALGSVGWTLARPRLCLHPRFPGASAPQHSLVAEFHERSGGGGGRRASREAADCARAPRSFAGYEGPGSVLVSPVPHQMLPYMNVGTLSRSELQLLNQLHCRRKRRHRTIFTDEQLEALENLFQETKYPDVGTREQLARKVHLREEKVEVGAGPAGRAEALLGSQGPQPGRAPRASLCFTTSPRRGGREAAESPLGPGS